MESKSTLSIDLLRKYVTDQKTFIETGTANGEGVQVALDYGFKKIVSIEVNPEVYVKACQRFAMESHILLAMGGSAEVLPQILHNVNEPAIIWLDAHWSTGEDPLPPGVLACPILAELHALANHPIKNHLLIMDDMRYFKTGIDQWHNITMADIIDQIMNINPNYWITLESGIAPNDILIAKAE